MALAPRPTGKSRPRPFGGSCATVANRIPSRRSSLLTCSGRSIWSTTLGLYKQAVTLAPDSTQYREYLGEYYQTLKRVPEALETWRAIAAGKHRNARSLGRLAEILSSFGHQQESLAPIAEAIALEADDFDLRTQ